LLKWNFAPSDWLDLVSPAFLIHAHTPKAQHAHVQILLLNPLPDYTLPAGGRGAIFLAFGNFTFSAAR
jgi:hypothetical protein